MCKNMKGGIIGFAVDSLFFCLFTAHFLSKQVPRAGAAGPETGLDTRGDPRGCAEGLGHSRGVPPCASTLTQYQALLSLTWMISQPDCDHRQPPRSRGSSNVWDKIMSRLRGTLSSSQMDPWEGRASPELQPLIIPQPRSDCRAGSSRLQGQKHCS